MTNFAFERRHCLVEHTCADCTSCRLSLAWGEQTFAGQDEWMEELLGDEYYVELFAEIAESEPITEAIDEVPAHLNVAMLVHCVAPSVVDLAACDPTDAVALIRDLSGVSVYI